MAFGDDWFRLQPNFRIATSAFHMDMWSFARRPFIGEEKIAEAVVVQEIGLSEFCRNCGPSTLAVASPSMNLTDQSVIGGIAAIIGSR
jgi:hypothetical protein